MLAGVPGATHRGGMTRRLSPHRAALAPVVVAALVLSACASGGSDAPNAAGGGTSTAPGASSSAAGSPSVAPSPPSASPAPSSGAGSGRASALPGTGSADPATVTPRVTGTVASGLRSPWGLVFLPDGGALLSERDTGRILRLDGRGGTAVVGTVPGVAHGGEGGLLGLAVSPRFASDRLVYAYLTTARDNRVVTMRWAPGGALSAPSAVVTGIPRASNHNGGRLTFGPDGMLYVSTGDASVRGAAQDVGSLGGKILRVTASGSPAPGNPFPGSPVWSLGHRNVQGLAFDAEGRLFASEFGQNTWDELNLIRRGGNYGWPVVEGTANRAGYVDPLRQWPTSQASPSGIAVAQGAVWMAALRGQRLWRVPLTGSGTATGTPTAFFSGMLGRLRTVAAAPDGSLWLVTSTTDGRQAPRRGGDRVLRLTLG